jgi:hypothetical protein
MFKRLASCSSRSRSSFVGVQYFSLVFGIGLRLVESSAERFGGMLGLVPLWVPEKVGPAFPKPKSPVQP